MDSSGDESFVWSRASTSSEATDDEKFMKSLIKKETTLKGKKSIKKEKVEKDEKTELITGSSSGEKKRLKKTRVKRESSSDGDTKPVVDKFSADETEVETRRPRRNTRQSADSDTGHHNDTRRPRCNTRQPADSDTGHHSDTRRPRRSTRQSTDSDTGHHSDTRRPRRSTRQSTDSDTGHHSDTRRPRRSTRQSTDSDTGHHSDTRRPRHSTRQSADDTGHHNDTRRPRHSTRKSAVSDTGHHNDSRRPRRNTRHSTDSDTGGNNNVTRRTTLHSTDTESDDRHKKASKSPKVSPNKPITSKEYVNDSSSCDEVIVKQNGTTSDSMRTKPEVNGHRDSESSTNSRAHKNKDRTSLSSSKSRRNSISDRIQLKDEEVSGSESQPEPTNKLSSRMKRHLKANEVLKQVDVTATAWPGPDDELWLLHVPTDLDETTLKGTTLTLDDKCKVKVDGQTYEGKSEGDRLVTLLTHRDGCVIENVALVNTVRFRRKNPRPRAIEDNGHNESEVMPMPVTKRRHPLFGVDYKKSIKLPSAVRNKLKAKTSSSMEADVGVPETMEVDAVQTNAQAQDDDSDKRKKRKRKKERDSDIGSAALDPGYSGGESGAKRRRKHRDTKWDSDKAIEESLFNF